MNSNKPQQLTGVIIACCDSDLHLAIGGAESVRYFMPDAPLTLVYDGSKCLQQIEESYGLTVIRKGNTKSAFLQNKSYGYGVTKMVAFWESPYETFLYFDSDALCWGNLLEHYSLDNLDMITPLMGYAYDESALSKWFFDVQWLSEVDPGFKTTTFADKYFCTGAYFARRGIFDIEFYEWLLARQAEVPSRFLFGEMGLLNYMIFSSVQRGSLRIAHESFQYTYGDSTWQKTFEKFPFKQGRPTLNNMKPQILHYTSPKPYAFNHKVHSRPMRFFRIKAMKRLNPKMSDKQALVEVLNEDYRKLKVASPYKRVAIASQAIAMKALAYSRLR